MQIDVLFEHNDFIVVDKPAGIAVQNEQQQSGILPILCEQLRVERLWLVHRLDKITSGLLILAKSSQAAAVFGQLFERKSIEKFYLAIASKKPKKKQGSIKGGMAKVRDGKWKLTQQTNNLAYSQFFSYSILPNIRLFLVKPLTGKTHQIRVALKSLGSPILGDQMYKGDKAERTYLHAYAIKFEYQDESIHLVCPPKNGVHYLSAQICEKISTLTTPWDLPWPSSK